MKNNILFLTLLFILLLAAGPIYAGNATVQIYGGNLYFQEPTTLALPSTLLGGGDKLIGPIIYPLTIIDNRGTGDGWTVYLNFDDLKVPNDPGRIIPPDCVTVALTQNSIVTNYGLKSDNARGPFTDIPLAAPLTNKRIRICHANRDTGMGSYILQIHIYLKVPASAYLGNYNANLKPELVSGQ